LRREGCMDRTRIRFDQRRYSVKHLTISLCGARVIGAVAVVSITLLAVGQAGAAEAKVKGKVGGATTAGRTPTSNAVPAEPSFLGVGIGLFAQDTERTQRSLIGGQESQQQEPQELVSASVFNVQVWYLRPLLVPGLRWGAGVAWFSS